MMVHELYEGLDGLTLTRIGVDYMARAPDSFQEIAEEAKNLLDLKQERQD